MVDSGSTDQTVAIAKSFGARVYDRDFTDFADQKNFAIEKCKRSWVLALDADEVVSPDMRSYFEQSFAVEIEPLENVCFRLTRYLIFDHKKMRFGKTKDAPIRLFPSNMRYEGIVHEVIRTETAQIKKLHQGYLEHHSYKNHADYFSRFNRYTTEIAKKHYQAGKSFRPGITHWLRPFIEFISRYVIRGGFLDGRRGYTYALYSSLYAYVKYEKLLELESSGISESSVEQRRAGQTSRS